MERMVVTVMATSYDEETMAQVSWYGCDGCAEDSERPPVVCPRCTLVVCQVCVDDGHGNCRPELTPFAASKLDRAIDAFKAQHNRGKGE